MRNKAGNELTRKLGPIQINSVFLRSYEEGTLCSNVYGKYNS